MASALEHSVEFDFHIENALSILNSYRNSSCTFVLKTEQETAVKELLKGNDVLAVLPTGFGKSIIFIVYLLARSSFVEQTRGSSQSSVLVVSPLKSIICMRSSVRGIFVQLLCDGAFEGNYPSNHNISAAIYIL